MAEKTIDTRLKIRGDTASNWSSVNPTLLKNELGYDETNKKFKIGDGTTPWNSLSYCNIAPSNSGIYYIEGTGTTAGTWLGSNTEITSYYDGLTILYKVNIAGASTTKLNINSLGAKTVYRYGSTKLTTQYSVNSVIIVTYMADLNSGCWMVIGDYDANTYQRLYPTTSDEEYPITTRYNTTTGSSYYAEYGRYSTGVTLNPLTKTITATKFNGTATRAIADENGNNIASTYALKSEISGGSVNLEPIYIGEYGNQEFEIEAFALDITAYQKFLQNKTAPIRVGNDVFRLSYLSDEGDGNYTAIYELIRHEQTFIIDIGWYTNGSSLGSYHAEINGSELNYVPEITSGVKVGTLLINSDEHEIYAPEGGGSSVNLEPINIRGTIAGWFTDFYIDGADITTDTYYQFLQNKTAPIMVEGTVFQLDHYEDYGNGDFYGSYSFRDGMYSYDISIQWSLDNSYLEESTASGLRSDMGPIDTVGSVSFEGEFSLRDVYITIANYNHFTSNNNAPLQIGDIVFQLDTLSYVGYGYYRAKYSYIYLNKKCYVTVCWEPENLHIDEFYEEEISGSGGGSGNEWQPITGSINFNTEFIGSPMYISVAKNTAEGKYTLTMNSRNDDTGFYVGYYDSNEVYFNDSETGEEYEIYMHEETSDTYIYEVKVSSLGEIYDSGGPRVLPIDYSDSNVCIVTKNGGSSGGSSETLTLICEMSNEDDEYYNNPTSYYEIRQTLPLSFEFDNSKKYILEIYSEDINCLAFKDRIYFGSPNNNGSCYGAPKVGAHYDYDTDGLTPVIITTNYVVEIDNTHTIVGKKFLIGIQSINNALLYGSTIKLYQVN